MSWLSKGLRKAGKGLKRVGKAVGKGWEAIDDYALPAIGFALGGPAGAALGAAGARAIGDGKFNAAETLKAGVKGYALGGLGQAAGLAGGQGMNVLGGSAKAALANPVGTAGKLLGGAVNPSSAMSAGGAPGAAAVGGGKLDMLKKIGGFAMDNSDLLLGGLAGYQGYKADKKADKLRQQQMDLAMQRWNETAPLRKLGQSQMLDQTREDLYPTYRNAANPFG